MSNFLSVRKDYDIYEPPIPRYEGDVGPKVSKLSQLLPETPETITSPNSLVAGRDPNIPTQSASTEDANIMESANALLPMMKSMSVRGGTVAGSPLADPTVDISPPLADITGEISPPTDGVQPLNALTPAAKDYWKQPVIGNMPLDKFVQLAGMTAHALDPKGFGGVLGKDLAQYATTERDVESKNALAKLNMEHTTLANQKLKQELDPNSSLNAVRQAQLKREKLSADESLRKTSREYISDIDFSTNPEAYTLTVNKLKEIGADTSLLPDVKMFQNSDGTINQELFNKWRNNFITTADQKARMSYEDQKERVDTVTVYNEKEGKQIKWTYVRPKGTGVSFDPVKEIGEGWSLTAPAKPTTPRQPTPYSTFYNAGKAAGKSDEQIVTEWRVKEKAASAEDKVMLQVVDANGDLVWKKRSDIKSGEKVNTKEPRLTPQQVLDAESLINSKGTDGIVLGAKPEGKPRVDAVNTHDTKGVIYRQVDKIEKGFFGGETKIPTLEKVQLPIVNDEQVTGQDIYIAAKQSKGKYTFDQVYQKLLDKVKGVKK